MAAWPTWLRIKPATAVMAVKLPGNIAVTSLAALAMMAGGHQPGRNIYGDNVTRALRYVLDQADPAGISGQPRRSIARPHVWAWVRRALSLRSLRHGRRKACRERLQDTLRRSVKLIVDSQNKEGGWRYHPGSTDADISVTICQIMGLRAARNAGFYVPKSTVDRCTKYVMLCQERDGGFRYQAVGGPSQFARSAAGVVALYCAGIYKGREVDNGLQLPHAVPPWQGRARQRSISITTTAIITQPRPCGRPVANSGRSGIPPSAIKLVNNGDRLSTGGWIDHRFSNDYATAMACIILQIPNNYLPILQK